MKYLDRISVIFFSLSLFLVCILIPAFCCAKSPSFYEKQFEKNGIYASLDDEGNEIRTPIYFINGEVDKIAYFTDEQFNSIIHHIIDYLFGDTESFELILDDVKINRKIVDNVSIFGTEAVVHMEDVKNLFNLFWWILIILIVLMIIILGYFIYRIAYIKQIAFKYSMIVYTGIIILAGIFCLWCYIDLIKSGYDINIDNYCYILWGNCHYLFFPLQQDKVDGSSFNDALTEILTLELFMDAVILCVVILIIGIILWLILTYLGKKLINNKKILINNQNN